MEKVYSMDEVANHNDEKDLWMVMNGNVYDLTKFLKEHPGGEEVLINLAGQDGSQCFDDIGHSFEAITLRESFKIGQTDNKPAEKIETNKLTSTDSSNNNDNADDDDWQYEEPKKESSNFLPIIFTLGFLIYAVIFYRLYY
ncbi:cytochrome b5-like [Leptopilina heterotoma]|uniref:cytochrome b5-like n=1 Tax=Leptopilina heterotoma TaxID=63436 RepID=UPI001CA99302|nr:cytochrome b5-like [Leptopilina heterotoma]